MKETLLALMCVCLAGAAQAKDKPLAQGDSKALEAQLPGMRSCVATAVKDDRKVEGVLEVRGKVKADGAFAHVATEGLLAGPMMSCIDEKLKAGPGLAKREAAERVYFRLRILAADGKGEVRLHPNVGPFIGTADGAILKTAMADMAGCVAKAKSQRKTGRARTEIVIGTDGSVLTAHLTGKKLDDFMTHCMAKRLKKLKLAPRKQTQYVEFALLISPEGVKRGSDEF